MEEFTPMLSNLGGILIGLAAVSLLHINGRIAGICGIVVGFAWNMIGFWPGLALTALVSGQTLVWILFVAMLVWMYAESTLNVVNCVLTQRGETVNG